MQKKHFAPEAAEVHPAISFDLAASSKTAGTSSRPGQSTLCKAKGCDRKLSIRMNDYKPKPFKAFAAAACQRGWKFDEALGGFLCPEHATQPDPVEAKRDYQRPTRTKPTAQEIEAVAAAVTEWLKVVRGPEREQRKAAVKRLLGQFGIERIISGNLQQFAAFYELMEDFQFEEPMPNESTPAIRQPDRDQKRAIFKEIDECYDIPNRRYIDPHTDKAIGEKLKMPWAWVAAVREENFGPAGPDPKIGEFDRELKALRQRADKLETDALAAYESAEKAADKLRADIAALEVKLAVLV